ncbi:MAG: DUF4276 family protein [Clostridiaceae bacterium]|nr:DUF4276 family protein [Clostridiaceae bacterium]
MHLEILSEDRSGSLVLEAVLHALRERRGYEYTFRIRPHRGKGYTPADPYNRPARDSVGLLDLLPAKSRAYARVLDPAQNLLIVVMDADDIPPEQVEGEIRSTLRRFASPVPHVIGICVEEIEAWMLGDRRAILAAYPDANLKVVDHYKQDSVCGTWEVLARCIHPESAERIIRIGYPAVGQYKHTWCRDISKHMDVDHNASPSFRRFLDHVDKAVRLLGGMSPIENRVCSHG